MTTPQQRGMFFEEFEVGMTIVTSGRTVTETDIVNFAGLSGDYNEIHTNAAFSETSAFGKRVAHGLLGLSIASGLAVQTGFMEGTVLAFREVKSWKFSKPIFIGDTIHVVMEVLEIKALRRLGGGSITIKLKVINQEDDTLMSGEWVVLIASKPKD